jgi:antitoxin FitA
LVELPAIAGAGEHAALIGNCVARLAVIETGDSTGLFLFFRPRSLRLDNNPYVMHNECMPLIQVRDVPEDVRDELARKAALAGKSLQSYLLGELTKLSERPSMAEIVARNQARARATGSTVTMSDAVAAVRAERDRHET